jgi:hypothetical protein
MQVTWLLDETRFEEGDNVERLKQAIRESGSNIIDFRYVGFDSIHGDVPEIDENPVVIIGSINAIMSLRKLRTSHTPGDWCLWSNFRSTVYMTHFNEHMLHNHFCFLPYKLLVDNYEGVYANYQDFTGKIFIKSNSGAKLFDGTVVHYRHFHDAIKELGHSITDTELMLISTPSQLSKEWRVIIGSDDQVVTGSQYRDDVGVKYSEYLPNDLHSFINFVLTKVEWRPAPIFCMDIALTKDGRYGIIELGGVNCAGLYACDMQPFVEECNRIAIEEHFDMTHFRVV